MALLGPPSAGQQPADDLLHRLLDLEARIGALQIEASTGEVETATDVYRLEQLYHIDRFGTTRRTEFSGRLRFGADYNTFSSRSVVSRVGGDAEESLRRLDELLAEVEEIVDRSGSAQARALLDEAYFFRNQAEAELSGGDEEAALEDMSISESLALEAARVAGGAITTEREDKEWDGFTELQLQWTYRPGPATRHKWTNAVREGDEYFQERLQWEIEHELSDRSTLLFETDTRIRDYQDAILDDYFAESTDLRWRWRPAEHWTVRLENTFDIKSEYEAEPDEGYWSDFARMVLEYSWGSFHQIQLAYDFRIQEFLSDEEEDFNSERHRLQQRYDCYGRRWEVSVSAEEQWRDYNKPLDEDDYRQVELRLDTSVDLLAWLSIGAEGGFELRRYDLRGDTNTDYREWRGGPVLELRWTGDVFQTLRYQWTGRTHQDRDGTDEIDKKIGDFDEHRATLETWWSLSDRLTVSANLEGEWRWYRNGQTGEYEIFLPDYRPISNYTRYLLSSNLDYDLTDRIRFLGSVYLSEETHKRFSDFDLREGTANFEVRISF